MEFLDEELNQYAEAHTYQEDELLEDLNRETNEKILKPRMLSGHMQGRVLSTFSHMIRPHRVLEVGTYTGYSALCLAEGLQEDGRLYTIDVNEELEEMVRRYLARAGVNDKVDYRIGNALDIIPAIDEEWDLVFIDADKVNYANYFDLTVDNVRPGGFIIADNVLWSGKVLEKNRKKLDEDTEAIMAFNDKVHRDVRVENVLFPVRDGLMVMRKR
ncbi:O-methyltransferase [Roseivirga sp. BDSF3-8]|uniref:O-methyltransferase n=1 Tax=Roseivirga sp. BDSF3-8 TaxID=3241598 RepID=UPI003531A1A1